MDISFIGLLDLLQIKARKKIFPKTGRDLFLDLFSIDNRNNNHYNIVITERRGYR